MDKYLESKIALNYRVNNERGGLLKTIRSKLLLYDGNTPTIAQFIVSIFVASTSGEDKKLFYVCKKTFCCF